MKAQKYYAPGDIRLEELPDPRPTPRTMVLEILSCAICGSDLKSYKKGNPRIEPPVVLGHEFVARVAEVGGEVTDYAPGDRVTMCTTITCGKCRQCISGLRNLCQRKKPVSYAFDGAYAQLMGVPEIAMPFVLRVPEDMPADTGTLAEPLSCVLNGIEVVNLAPGETVLVIGAGPMGAMNAQAAKAKGAGRVIVTDPVASRLEMARRLGADVTVDVSKPGCEARIMDATGGRGADVVIVTAPVPAVQAESINYATEGGRINLFASLPPSESVVPFDTRTIHYKELVVTGSTDSRREQMEEAIDMLAAGDISADVFITHRLPLEKLLDGLALMERRESLKVVIHPNGTPEP